MDELENKKNTAEIAEKATKSLGIVVIFAFISKLLGFARDIVLAYFYGAGNVSDAYLVSLTIPEFLFSLVIQAIAIGFIPIYTKIVQKEGKKKGNEFTSQVLTILYILAVIVVVFVNLFPSAIVSLFANGFDGETREIAVSFIQITTATIFFKGTVSVLSAYCQANGEFNRPSLVGIPLDIVTIVSIYISFKYLVIWLAYGTVIAYASQLLVLVPYCIRKKYFYQFKLKKDPYIKQILLLFLPVMLSVGANQINVLIDKSIASTVASGGISALNYANKVDNMMENIIVLSIAGAMFPVFSNYGAKKEYENLSLVLRKTLDLVSYLILPITVGAIIFAKPLIELLFKYGAFDGVALEMTYLSMVGYSIGMIGVSYRAILTRFYYALDDIKRPTINAVISIFINIVLDITLSRIMGLMGLAVASSISSLVCSVLLIIGLKEKIEFSYRKFLFGLIKIIIVSALMGGICYCGNILLINYLSDICSMGIMIIFGVIFYLSISIIFKIPGYEDLKEIVLRKNRKQ